MAAAYDIFISVHVQTLGAVAQKVKEAIERASGGKKKVFLCTDIVGGVSYRDEITLAVKSSQVFVALMNFEWASSGECELEFLLAKRLNLTSHERMTTKSPKARRPFFLPIAFPSLNPWSQFSHVELLAARTNFITADSNNSMSESILSIVSDLAIRYCDPNVEEGGQLALPTSTENIFLSFGTLKASLDALDVYLRQASSVLETANSFSNTSNKLEPGKVFPLPKQKYIGFTYGKIHEFAESIFSLEFRLNVNSKNKEDIEVSGMIVYKICSVRTTSGFEKAKDVEFVTMLQGQVDKEAEIRIKGKYSLYNGLLSLDDTEVLKDDSHFTTHPMWKKDSYRLLLSANGNELSGVLRGWDGKWDIAFRADAF